MYPLMSTATTFWAYQRSYPATVAKDAPKDTAKQVPIRASVPGCRLGCSLGCVLGVSLGTEMASFSSEASLASIRISSFIGCDSLSFISCHQKRPEVWPVNPTRSPSGFGREDIPVWRLRMLHSDPRWWCSLGHPRSNRHPRP